MRATGIVRRIDDLGRVVIPKEIRRTMRIREGDPLEIYTDGGGEVIFKKYSPIGERIEAAEECVKALASHTALYVAICDRERCITCSGKLKNDIKDAQITKELQNIMEERRTFSNPQSQAMAFKGSELSIAAASPIVTQGDVAGCVLLIKNEKQSTAGETDIKLCSLISKILEEKTE